MSISTRRGYYCRGASLLVNVWGEDISKGFVVLILCLSVNDDPNKMNESISALANSLSNSIWEKCAAIKKASMLQIKDDIAEK